MPALSDLLDAVRNLPASEIEGVWHSLAFRVDRDTGFFEARPLADSGGSLLDLLSLPDGDVRIGAIEIIGNLLTETVSVRAELSGSLAPEGLPAELIPLSLEAVYEDQAPGWQIAAQLRLRQTVLDVTIERSPDGSTGGRVLGDLRPLLPGIGERLPGVEPVFWTWREPELRLFGESAWMAVEVTITDQITGRISIPAGVRFAQVLGDDYEPLDALFPELPGGDLTAGNGVAVSIPLSLGGTGFDALLDLEEVRVSGRIGRTIELSAAVSFDPIGGIIAPRDAAIFVANGPVIGLRGALDVAVADPPLAFSLETTFAAESVQLTGRLDRWDRPFDVRGLVLTDLWLRLGRTVTGTPTIGIAGHARFGHVSGAAAFTFDAVDPRRNMVALSFAEIPVAALFSAFFDTDVADLGGVVLRDATVRIVPPGGAFGGWREGIAIASRISFAIEDSPLEGDAAGSLDPVAGLDLRGSLSWDPLESTCRHASLSIL